VNLRLFQAQDRLILLPQQLSPRLRLILPLHRILLVVLLPGLPLVLLLAPPLEARLLAVPLALAFAALEQAALAQAMVCLPVCSASKPLSPTTSPLFVPSLRGAGRSQKIASAKLRILR
jgi:hypothetical protein